MLANAYREKRKKNVNKFVDKVLKKKNCYPFIQFDKDFGSDIFQIPIYKLKLNKKKFLFFS